MVLVAWWSRIPASNDRDWAPEYAVLPRATIEGDRVTLHNLRNFDYRTTESAIAAPFQCHHTGEVIDSEACTSRDSESARAEP